MGENCKYKKECGSCSLLDTSYAEQLEQKTKTAQAACGDECVARACVGCFYPYKYRNKIHLAFSKTREGLNIGFFEAYSHRVINIDECILHGEWASKLIAILRKYVKLSKIDVYDMDEQSGNLRYAVARFIENTLMLTLVIYENNIGGLNFLYDDLRLEFKSVGIYLNINKTDTSAVFGDTFIHKYGETKQPAQMLGAHFFLSPQTFFQVNIGIATKIYQKVLSLIEPKANQTVLDLYSGIGISSLLLARSGANIIAIEVAPDSVAEAKRLAKSNNASNITCYCGKCEDILPKLDIAGEVTAFLDPPRKGCAEPVLNKLLEIAPNKIIYLSCSPESLSCDLKTLSPKYKVALIQPYDMFCQTPHLETLVYLARKD